jgi:cell division protein FtsI (penicillin-binding protein 3)
MTAAEMRKMMEGVVLYGSGRPAQLNGYSSGGKTGTAQKIDPATHTYSKTMHIASFAGIAPVNNPVIAIAVVIDNPTRGPSYYGTAVSAPVFAEVAQGVLEYLGVPHDVDVREPKTKAKAEKPVTEDEAHDSETDINALFAAVNDLPSDDPLRAQPAAGAQGSDAARNAGTAVTDARAKLASFSPPASESAQAAPLSIHPSEKPAPAQEEDSVVAVSTEDRSLKVPSLIGLPLRKVIEVSAAAGLEVQMIGNGTAREQAPSPGTIVARGTQIVVRCAR